MSEERPEGLEPDLEARAEEAEEVRGGARPPRDPQPPTPGGPVPIPYPNN